MRFGCDESNWRPPEADEYGVAPDILAVGAGAHVCWSAMIPERPRRVRFGFLLVLAVAALVVVGRASAQQPVQSPLLLMISVDGLRPDHVTAADSLGLKVPNLRRFLSEGTYADGVQGVIPTVTYPSHTTLITGVWPARHGIHANMVFDPLKHNQSGWYWYAEDIRVPTLWDAVHAAGGTTAAISWPVTVGARVDWNVPDVWLPDNPASIAPIRAATMPPGLFEELEREATGRLSDATFSIDSLGREDAVGAIAAYLFERHQPTLMLVHNIGLDHVRHRLGRDNPRARRAVAAADRALARVVESVERLDLLDRTTFVVTGDHGSVDVHTALLPNVWLREAGLTLAHHDADAWRVYFHASGGSAGSCSRA